MADKNSNQPIVVKKVKKNHHGHHGGAWKIAYADFVTAMMAFFLLMWLLNSMNHANLEGLANYFKMPLRVALMGGPSVGYRNDPTKDGGQDVQKQQGQVKTDDANGQDKIEVQKLEVLKQQVTTMINTDPTLQSIKNQLRLEITKEGLRIQMVDEDKRPMFDMGSDKLQPHTQIFLQKLAGLLNKMPNKISITGHTDAAAYSSGNKDYSNWELSADRANSSRRVLEAAGLSPDKVLKVVGTASTYLLDEKNPLDPINRRISIIVLNKKAEDVLKAQETGDEISTADSSPVQVNMNNTVSTAAQPPSNNTPAPVPSAPPVTVNAMTPPVTTTVNKPIPITTAEAVPIDTVVTSSPSSRKSG